MSAATTKKTTQKRPASDHPTYKDMIKAAVGELAGRKGASRQAIKKYIFSTYKITESSVTTSVVNRSIKKLLDEGKLQASEKYKGSYKWVGKEEKKKKAPKSSAQKKKPAAKKPKAAPAKKAAAKKPKVKKATTGAKKSTVKKTATKKPAKKAVKKTPKKSAQEKKTVKKTVAKKK